jgi:phosphoglycerate dehydrogenase-like enzyme
VAAPSRTLVVDLNATSSAWKLPPWAEERIQTAAPDGWRVHVVRAPTISDGDGGDRPSGEALAAIAEAEVYAGFGMPTALYEAARRLRWVHTAAAGVGSLLSPAFVQSDVLLTNAAGVHAEPIAEYVLGGVLHFLRGFDFAVAQQRTASWERARFVGAETPLREIGECRVLIVGAGGIGSAVARRLHGAGARCVGVRRRPELGAPDGFERVITMDEVDAELALADVVVIAAPLTGETRGVLDARRLALLQPRAIVVNVARGSLIDERALIAALAGGRLRGAVLDVFEREPLADDSPLWSLPNVLLTPHVSAVSPARFWERGVALLVENWERYERGEPLRNLVDKAAGY